MECSTPTEIKRAADLPLGTGSKLLLFCRSHATRVDGEGEGIEVFHRRVEPRLCLVRIVTEIVEFVWIGRKIEGFPKNRDRGS